MRRRSRRCSLFGSVLFFRPLFRLVLLVFTSLSSNLVLYSPLDSCIAPSCCGG